MTPLTIFIKGEKDNDVLDPNTSANFKSSSSFDSLNSSSAVEHLSKSFAFKCVNPVDPEKIQSKSGGVNIFLAALSMK